MASGPSVPPQSFADQLGKSFTESPIARGAEQWTEWVFTRVHQFWPAFALGALCLLGFFFLRIVLRKMGERYVPNNSPDGLVRFKVDELAEAARPFDTMASKIDMFKIDHLERSRMGKELETAKEVQMRYQPPRTFAHPAFSLCGNFLPAAECSGDWWNHAQIGDRLWVVIGDVTGHGAASALVSAAVHGAFSVFVSQLKAGVISGTVEQLICEAALQLNEAVLSAAQKRSGMSAVISVIDLAQYRFWALTAGHPSAGVVRPRPQSDLGECVHLIACKPSRSLGEVPRPEFARNLVFESFDLQPGDFLVWHTDGLLEGRNKNGKTIPRLDLFQNILALEAHGSESVESLAERLMIHLSHQTGFGPAPDDITLILGRVTPRVLTVKAKRRSSVA